MKNAKRFFVITFMLAFILSISSINAFAATVTQDNLEVTLVTDKEKYSENEQIKTTLTVKNNNDTAVTNVDLETALPDGYKLADKSENKKTVDSIAAGESVSLDVTLEKDNTKKESTPSEPSTDPKSSTNPVSSGNSGGSGTTTGGTTTNGSAVQTGQVFLNIGIILVVLLAAGTVFVLARRKKLDLGKSAKRLMSVILCFALLGGSVACLRITIASAESAYSAIEINTEVKVANEDVKIYAKVAYGESNKTLTVTFDSVGGSAVESIKVKMGETISSPEDPKKDGYIFLGWFSSTDYEDLFLFDDEVITEDITLYAKWIQDDPETITAEYILNSIVIGFQDGDNYFNVTRSITLPTKPEDIDDIDIVWTSSNTELIDSEGNVTRNMPEDTEVTLTASVTVNKTTKTKDFNVTVIRTRTETPIDDQTVVDIQNNNADNDDFDITYNDEQNQVVSIDGEYSDIVINNSEDAIDAIQSIRSIIGLTDAYSELGLFSSSIDDYGREYAFYQYYNGIRVYGRSVSASADENGVADFMYSNVLDPSLLQSIDYSSYIGKEDAEAVVRENYGKVFSKNTERIIYSFDDYENNPSIAYLVYCADSEADAADKLIILNAVTKEIICELSLILDDSTATGSGRDEFNNKVSFPVTFTWTDWYFYYMYDPASNVQVYYKGLLNDYRVGSEFNTWNDSQQVSAYINMRKVANWWKSKFNRNSLDDKGMKIDIVTHDNTYSNNAFWQPSNKRIYITDISGSVVKHSRAVADDVITHESTHAVLQYELGMDFANYYYNAPGAINEGYADTFGCLQNNNWTHGENLYDSSSIEDGVRITCTRNIANPEDPSAKNQGPDRMSSNLYVNYRVDSSDNGGVHTNGFLVSHAAYLMNNFGISTSRLYDLWYQSIRLKQYNRSSNFVSVRKTLIKAAKKIGMTDQEKSTIRKAFDDEEIYDERGKISIRFVDEKGNPVSESLIASLSMQRTKLDTPQPTIIRNTDTVGTTEIDNIYFGTYATKVSVPGYMPFESNVEIKTGKTTKLDIPLIKEGEGIVKGKITSATTGYPIEAANLKIYKEWSVLDGTVVGEVSSNANGEYSATLPAGYYTIVVSKEGYSNGYIYVAVSGGKTINNKNASISPIMTFGKDFRVVLTWGANPSDLDSHLFGQQSDGSNYHIYFSNKNSYDSNGNKIANLDVDDTTSFGPETTTFTAETAGSYEYYIDWYAGSGTWATCGGKVEVYNGDRLMYVFNVPSNNTKLGSWKVFTFKNGIFNPVNVIQSEDIY